MTAQLLDLTPLHAGTSTCPTEQFIIQMPDDQNCDTSLAYYYGWNNTVMSAGQFITITCPSSGRKYLGQIIAPQINLNRDALTRFDNTTINQLEAVQQERFHRDVVIKEVFYYKVKLLRDISGATPKSVRRRPQTAALGQASTEDEIIRYIGLPKADPKLQIGAIIDTDIAVCFDQRTGLHHTLAAGSTGSGKSNTLGSIACAAISAGACVIICDHKPDYQNITEPNDEGSQPWFRGLSNVSYWRLGGQRRNAAENNITVPASSLDSTMIASAIFHHPNEYNQKEAADTLLEI
jgi:hypothetical protein